MVMLPDVAEQNPYTKKKKYPVVKPVAQPPPVATTPPAVTPPQQAAPQLGIPVTSTIDPNYTRAVTTGTPYTPNTGAVAATAARGKADELLENIQERLSQPASLTSSPYYKAAMKAAEQRGTLASRRAMEELNTRGILSSTVTSDRVAQIQQQALTDVLPSIMERAYGIQQDELRNMINLANLYMQQVQRQQEAETKQQQQTVENAWSRVKNLGYVDNEASIVLGIPAGTLSADAKRYDEDRKLRERIAAEQASIQWANVTKRTPKEEYLDEAWEAYRQGTATPEQLKAMGLGEKEPSPAERTTKAKADLFAGIRKAIEAGTDPETIEASIRAQMSDLYGEGLKSEDIEEALEYLEDLTEAKGAG